MSRSNIVHLHTHIVATLAVILAMVASVSFAAAALLPPCAGPGSPVQPAYGALGAGPAVGVWQDTTLALGGNCPEVLNGPAALIVALSSRFVHNGTVDDLAARVGAVSALEGLRYWSVTAGSWRNLISQSYALTDSNSRERRPDFSAAELLSGRTFFIAQRDTLSSGLNAYSLAATSPSEDQLVVSIVNQTDIRFVLATFFEWQALVSVHVFTRLRGNEWGYFSLTVVKPGSASGNEASYINRAAAFARFYTGRQPDVEPPVTR